MNSPVIMKQTSQSLSRQPPTPELRVRSQVFSVWVWMTETHFTQIYWGVQSAARPAGFCRGLSSVKDWKPVCPPRQTPLIQLSLLSILTDSASRRVIWFIVLVFILFLLSIPNQFRRLQIILILCTVNIIKYAVSLGCHSSSMAETCRSP